MMSKISVVTVTYKNPQGLELTLASLSALSIKPLEVIIIDGGSNDTTPDVISRYQDSLPLRFISERDNGIYDAMNKGAALASGKMIHYLNAGDWVSGEVYSEIKHPSLLNVHLLDNNNLLLGLDTVGHGGAGYCHQGIIFPANHTPYDARYRIAADFDLILRSFPNGLGHLPRIHSGHVCYRLDGISAKRIWSRDREMTLILIRNHRHLRALSFVFYTLIKNSLPVQLRRKIRKLVYDR